MSQKIVLCVGDTPVVQRAVAMAYMRIALKEDSKRPVLVHTSNNEDVWSDFGKKYAPEQFAGVFGSWSGRLYTEGRDTALASKTSKTCDANKLMSVLDFCTWRRNDLAVVRHAKRTDHVILMLTGDKNENLAQKVAHTLTDPVDSAAVTQAIMSIKGAERPYSTLISNSDPRTWQPQELEEFMIPTHMERIPIPNGDARKQEKSA